MRTAASDIPSDTPEQVLEEAAASCPGGALDGEGAPRLTADQQAAWVGFMATHSGVMRALEAGLNAEFGISIGALEVLSRLAGASGGQARMSDLAQGARLSPSRVSRVVDELQLRGLVERLTCPSDSRGVLALITPAGRELAERALRWHWTQVRERFLDPLRPEQVTALGAIWRAILGEL